MRSVPSRRAAKAPPSWWADRERAHTVSGTATSVSTRALVIASYLLVAGGLLLVMLHGLLPGLLCACVGFMATRWAARAFDGGLRRLHKAPPGFATAPAAPSGLARTLAAAIVMLAPMALLTAIFSDTRAFVISAPGQYQELLDYIARTILELRLKLPPEMAMYLPEGVVEVQRMVAAYLRTQAGMLALTGRAWLGALLFAYVGLLVGALAAASRPPATARPLTEQMRRRISLFGEAFGQIVAAQFWIATFNACLTAVFLIFLLPLWDLKLPYMPALITLTFVAGLVPIVGNLLCNAVITMVGLSVSPVAAAACLVFLIVIHKAEYLINAKVVGSRTHMAVWELLAVMFVAEAVFGPAGLVAAPLFYAYLKKELQAARLV